MGIRRQALSVAAIAALLNLGTVAWAHPPDGVPGGPGIPGEFIEALEAVEERTESIENKVDDLQDTADGIDAKVDTLQSAVDGIDGDVGGLQAAIEGVDAKVDDLQDSVNGVDAKVDALQAAVDALSGMASGPVFVSDSKVNIVTNAVVSAVEAPGKGFTLTLTAVCFFPSVSPDNRVVITVPQGDGLSGDSAVQFVKQEESDRIELAIGPVAGHAQDVEFNAELWAIFCDAEAGFNDNFDTLKSFSYTAWLEP